MHLVHTLSPHPIVMSVQEPIVCLSLAHDPMSRFAAWYSRVLALPIPDDSILSRSVLTHVNSLETLPIFPRI